MNVREPITRNTHTHTSHPSPPTYHPNRLQAPRDAGGHGQVLRQLCAPGPLLVLGAVRMMHDFKMYLSTPTSKSTTDRTDNPTTLSLTPRPPPPPSRPSRGRPPHGAPAAPAAVARPGGRAARGSGRRGGWCWGVGRGRLGESRRRRRKRGARAPAPRARDGRCCRWPRRRCDRRTPAPGAVPVCVCVCGWLLGFSGTAQQHPNPKYNPHPPTHPPPPPIMTPPRPGAAPRPTRTPPQTAPAPPPATPLCSGARAVRGGRGLGFGLGVVGLGFGGGAAPWPLGGRGVGAVGCLYRRLLVGGYVGVEGSWWLVKCVHIYMYTIYNKHTLTTPTPASRQEQRRHPRPVAPRDARPQLQQEEGEGHRGGAIVVACGRRWYGGVGREGADAQVGAGSVRVWLFLVYTYKYEITHIISTTNDTLPTVRCPARSPRPPARVAAPPPPPAPPRPAPPAVSVAGTAPRPAPGPPPARIAPRGGGCRVDDGGDRLIG